MKQKRKSILLAVVAFFAILTAGIIAYSALVKKSDIVHNELYIANLRGDIKETFDKEKNLQIGGTYQKEVTVENKGTTNLFVRVMVFPEIKVPLENGSHRPMTATIGQEIIVNLGTDWIDGGDGYYYYTKALPPKDKENANTKHITQALFSQVKLADTLDRSYVDAVLDMQIKSETVTASNYQYRKVWWNLDASTAPTETALVTVDDLLKLIVG